MWNSLAAVPILIAVNAFWVVAEYAVVAMGPSHLAGLRERGHRRTAAAAQRIKRSRASAIGAIQICITMSNLMLGWIGEPAMSWLLLLLFRPLVELAAKLLTPAATVLSFITVTYLTVVFSELLPKAMTLRHVQTAAVLTAVPVLLIQRLLTPLVWLMNTTANLVTRPLGLGKVEEADEGRITAAELRIMTLQAAEAGTLTPRERSLILNALALGRRRGKQILVHRMQVAYVDVQRTMEENRQVVESRLFTRLPLCDGGMDNVLGMIHAAEFLMAYEERGDSSVLRLIGRPAVFVPETLSADRLLEAFGQHRTEMLFLVDEYGTVEGIVTLQDVVDEILQPAE